MPIQVEHTPNPNALKFTVGAPVGGPQTFAAGGDIDDPMAAELLAIDGVVSVFKTADFVTLTKAADADWEDITTSAVPILESHLG